VDSKTPVTTDRGMPGWYHAASRRSSQGLLASDTDLRYVSISKFSTLYLRYITHRNTQTSIINMIKTAAKLQLVDYCDITHQCQLGQMDHASKAADFVASLRQ